MPLRWKIPVLSHAVYSVWKLDAARKLAMIEDWIASGERLLEVGSGPGSVIDVFREAGHNVTGLDIADNAFSPDLVPVVYDGGRMPFSDRAFDTALILTTLHHTPDPDHIIRESARIARRVIIIEDVFETRLQERYTKLTDKLTNFEFFGHPHTNRSDQGWRESFERMGLELMHAKVHRLLKLYQQAVYVVEPRA
ncbi:class I SAM-dependent methyltransferase [uncultured Erythrobacter sp.]|uniref:class I SAM-dependent methyltransferase n=1 Tax=uncultured Erythrobacter sp. TaxID=263913 RepID=UPI0026309C18|nr:class I SAM-dependent methyltransferase [uncultured Erythrobacter sp.]